MIVLCLRAVANDLLQMVILWRLWSLDFNAKVRVVKGRHFREFK